MLGTRWFGERAELFGWMAKRLDVDWGRTAGLSEALAVRHAVNTCLSCRNVGACTEAFHRPADEVGDLDFCPNRQLFARWSCRAEPTA